MITDHVILCCKCAEYRPADRVIGYCERYRCAVYATDSRCKKRDIRMSLNKRRRMNAVRQWQEGHCKNQKPNTTDQ